MGSIRIGRVWPVLEAGIHETAIFSNGKRFAGLPLAFLHPAERFPWKRAPAFPAPEGHRMVSNASTASSVVAGAQADHRVVRPALFPKAVGHPPAQRLQRPVGKPQEDLVGGRVGGISYPRSARVRRMRPARATADAPMRKYNPSVKSRSNWSPSTRPLARRAPRCLTAVKKWGSRSGRGGPPPPPKGRRTWCRPPESGPPPPARRRRRGAWPGRTRTRGPVRSRGRGSGCGRSGPPAGGGGPLLIIVGKKEPLFLRRGGGTTGHCTPHPAAA